MNYQIETTGNRSYLVKKDGKVHMSVSGPEDGPPPPRQGYASKEPDIEYTKEIAAKAVRYVRSKLPRGAFNNQMKIDGKYRYLTNNVAPRWLNARAETMYASLAYQGDQPRDTVKQMAARSIATLAVGGGVCSLMTYVTAGYLTTIAKRGTTIVAVFDKQYNHEYVVLCYGTSPYVVADPWVGTSYACLWSDCLFESKYVTLHTQMEIVKTLSVPFGVDFTAKDIETARKVAEMDRITNPPAKWILKNPEEQSLDKKAKYSWFHMDSVYAHPDNIQGAHQRESSLIVRPEEWGMAVVRTHPTPASDQPMALDWADHAATKPVLDYADRPDT